MFVNVVYLFTINAENDLQLEIRGKKENGAPLVYNKPCVFSVSPDEAAYSQFEVEVIDIRTEQFARYCKYGKLTKAQQMLKRGLVETNRFGLAGEGWSPLMHACYNGHYPVVEWLVDILLIDINQGCASDGWRPVHCAAAAGHEKIIVFLLAHFCDVLAQTHTLETPLSLAMNRGKLDVIAQMLAPGTPLSEALIASHGERKTEMLGMYNVYKPMAVSTDDSDSLNQPRDKGTARGAATDPLPEILPSLVATPPTSSPSKSRQATAANSRPQSNATTRAK